MKKVLAVISVWSSLLMACQSNNLPNPNPGQNPAPVGLTLFNDCPSLSRFLVSKVGTAREIPVREGGPSSVDAVPMAAQAPVTVEEGDIIRQEGNRLYVASSFEQETPAKADLYVYDVQDAAHPVRVGSFSLGMKPQEIYVQGSKVIVWGNEFYRSEVPTPQSKVLILDVTNPGAIQKTKELAFKGEYRTSRKIGSSIYGVVRETVQASQVAEANTDCDGTWAPEAIDGQGSEYYTRWKILGLSLVSNEVAAETSVIGSNFFSDIYATPEHFYITNYFHTTKNTDIYLFGVDPAKGSIDYTSKAGIPGSIVNQFSMDEYEGYFRIASTQTGEDGDFGPSSFTNYLTVFKLVNQVLTQKAQLDSIVPNEVITAVRFAGSRAYVSTAVLSFDPLVPIDMKLPESPKIMGELHLSGITQYIQAWGANYLIAVGTTDTWFGNVTLNLFDVSDMTNPRLIEQKILADSHYSIAQSDHRAFTFIEDRDMLAIPIQGMNTSEVQLFSVDSALGFSLVRSINHGDLIPQGVDYPAMLSRSLENDDFLYTISSAGLKVTNLNNVIQDTFGETFPGFEGL